MNLVLAGAGAFGLKHLDALKLIDNIQVVALVGRQIEPTKDRGAEIRNCARDDGIVRGTRAAGG